MLKKLFIFLITLSALDSLSIAQTANKPPIFHFESAEHISIGEQIKLQFEANNEGKSGIKLRLPNGLSLTYGELVTLGGDFYADPELPISLGVTTQEQEQRFIRAYNSLAVDPHAVVEAPLILAVVQDEIKQLQEGQKQGQTIVEIYSHMETDHNIAWNCITGGGCRTDYPNMSDEKFRKVYFLKQGRYLKIADHNFDHFGNDAWRSYSIGHTLALEKALAARKAHSTNLLGEAYAINAFSCHYLSDGFSSGHMRTPRELLYEHVIPSSLGSTLAVYMHNEDSEFGLSVSNARGDKWKAFGDRYYFDERNKRNREILIEAMQISASEIFETYMKGSISQDNKIAPLLPELTQFTKADDPTNTAALFYPQGRHLLRRVEVANPYNYEWTSDWWGWSTLLDLVESKGPLLENNNSLTTEG